ncbi:hypothetical protein T08_13425 [Trichinella sp. T8]|nr:hypothetical protein T08_13425 [Trichinella sp. T8]
MIYNWLAVKATLMSKNKKELQKLPTYGQLLKQNNNESEEQSDRNTRIFALSRVAFSNVQGLFEEPTDQPALAIAKALAPCDLKIEAAFPVSADVNNPKQRVPFALGSDSLTTVDRHMLRLLS